MEKNEKKAKSGDKTVNYIKYGFILLILIILAAVVFGIVYSTQTSHVAVVTDGKSSEKVSKAEFSYFVSYIKSNLLAQAGNVDPETLWKTDIGGEPAIDWIKKSALETLKELKVQEIKAKQAGIVLEKTDLDNVENMINSYVPLTQGKTEAEKYSKETYGVTVDELRGVFKLMSLANKLETQETKGLKYTENDLKAYYDKNPDKFKDTPDKLRQNGEEAVWARHILIVTQNLSGDKLKEAEKKAKDLLKRAKNGEDFIKLAKDNSEDTGSAKSGGDYVFGKDKMYLEFEKAAFELNPGQISNLVKTDIGYHIIKLEEKIPKGQPVSYRCAKEYREFGVQYLVTQTYQQKLDGWKSKFKIETNKPVYDEFK